MVVGQLIELFLRGVDQFGVSEPQPSAPETRHAFDIALAVFVVDIDAFTGFNDMRPGFAVLHGVRVRVQQGLYIAGLGV